MVRRRTLAQTWATSAVRFRAFSTDIRNSARRFSRLRRCALALWRLQRRQRLAQRLAVASAANRAVSTRLRQRHARSVDGWRVAAERSLLARLAPGDDLLLATGVQFGCAAVAASRLALSARVLRSAAASFLSGGCASAGAAAAYGKKLAFAAMALRSCMRQTVAKALHNWSARRLYSSAQSQ